MKKIILLVVLYSVLFSVNAKEIKIGDFSNRSLSGWDEKTFDQHSEYELVEVNNKWVLSASSNKTASALFYKKEINLQQTPYLNWSWSIDNRIFPKDETVKSGDDYVARIYVVKDGGLFVWNTIAINYVWSYQQPRLSFWDNAFAGKNARMLSLRDGTSEMLYWYKEKRNMREDFARFYPDEEVLEIDGVALMIDTDNTKSQARSYFGDIYFSSD